MTTSYKFDFSKMDFDSIERAAQGDFAAFLESVDRVCIGGIRHLPLREVTSVVLPQFRAEWDAWYEGGAVGDLMSKSAPEPIEEVEVPSEDDNDLGDMLDGIEGL